MTETPQATPSSAPRFSVAGRVPKERIEQLLGRVTLTGPGHATVPLCAPFTGEPVHDVPLGTADDLIEAAAQARAAQRDWARRGVERRARVLLRFHDLVLERQEELLDLIQLETGKARRHAFEEVADTAICARYYAHHGPALLRPHRRQGALPALTATWEHHQPLGLVGFITPWNYPLSLAITDALPALLAGNAAVLKPDQQTPLTALFAARLLDEAGLPPGLFHVVTGRGRELGTPLIGLCDYLGFTGSTATGRVVARQAGEKLIGCSMELGGKNPMILCEDADLEHAVEGAVRGCFASTGQLCVSIERIYAHASVYERFLSRFAERTRALKMGASFDYDFDLGSLVGRDQLEKVESHVRGARELGATVVAGGRARPELGPYFFEPTILTGVTEQMPVAREETFGPVVSVWPVDSIDEAVDRANDSDYGLNASVWTSDNERGVEIATRLQTGTVNVNEAYAAAWASVDAPMGGFKTSGLGRRHGAQGLLKYTEAQTIAVQRLVPLAAPEGTADEDYSRNLSRALKLLRRIPGLR
jgi:succinate-semialdehyde dehydrogenase/glutarate-semialdehyde dehydrogenase